MPIPKIFISYAHEDIHFQKDLLKRLKPLKRKGEIILWHDGVIRPGEEWDAAIKKHLAEADIIIILLSADFVDSDYIYEQELPEIIKRRKNGDIQLIPIVVRNITLEGTNIEMYQCLPQDEKRQLKPIIEWDNQQLDKVWVQIDKEIRGVINRFNNPDTSDTIVNRPPSLPPDIEPSSHAVDLKAIKKELKQATVKDLGKALEKLDTVLSDSSSLYNSLIQLKAQYSQYKRDSRMGIIGQENATIQRNKIVYAFQSIVDELEIADLEYV